MLSKGQIRDGLIGFGTNSGLYFWEDCYNKLAYFLKCMHIHQGIDKLVLTKGNNTWNLKESQYIWSSQRIVTKESESESEVLSYSAIPWTVAYQAPP